MRFPPSINILGINFFNGTVHELIEVIKKGGLFVIPAAPALSNIKDDVCYYESLLTANMAIADSGYMSLIWNAFNKRKIKRISGLEFLRTFLSDTEIKNASNILLVNPNTNEANANMSYLDKTGFNKQNVISYVSPLYVKTSVEDRVLLQIIETKKPKYIIINLGGGIQEKLGAYLKKNLSYRPAIICSGAAIAFLTGKQARIPGWADKLYLGWFFRCVDKPRVFIPRYFKALKLAFFIVRYKTSPYSILDQPRLSLMQEQK